MLAKNTLARELGVEDIARGVSYDIDSASMARLALLLEIDGVDGRAGRLRVRGWFDELPYTIHTGLELTMMLAGEKLLAVFCDDMPDVKNNGIVPTELFEAYVASGVMVRRARTYVMAGIRCRDVFYALATEAWRIDAYLLLIEVAERSGW